MKCLECNKEAELEEDFYHCYNCDALLCGSCANIINEYNELFCQECYEVST